MVAQQALGPQIPRRKATIPCVKPRAGAPISEMNEQLGLVRWRNWRDATLYGVEVKETHTGSNPVLTSKIKVMNNSHIPLEDMLDDLRITNEEIMEFEEENKVLSKNRERNRVQIYMNEGRILQRQKFVSQLEQLIEKTYPEHKINKL
jgi:hypothetical protein